MLIEGEFLLAHKFWFPRTELFFYEENNSVLATQKV